MWKTDITLSAARRLQARFGPDKGTLVLSFEDILERDGYKSGKKPLPFNSWGAMEVIDLTGRDAQRRNNSRQYARGYIGTFKHPHRAIIPQFDGCAWATKRKKKTPSPGSILVDCSGSMELSVENVALLVEKMPAATVAAYAGIQGSEHSGRLVVLARDGRVCGVEDSHLAAFGSGNIIDGPALEWLGHQVTPRVWISDGIVTGVHDCAAKNLISEVCEIERRFGIRRVATLEDYFLEFTSSRRVW